MKQTMFGGMAVLFLISTGSAFAHDGAAIYNKSCAACHNSMKSNIRSKSTEAMVKVTIDGKGAMRPRAGASLSDDEIRAAVVYMQSKGQ